MKNGKPSGRLNYCGLASRLGFGLAAICAFTLVSVATAAAKQKPPTYTRAVRDYEERARAWHDGQWRRRISRYPICPATGWSFALAAAAAFRDFQHAFRGDCLLQRVPSTTRTCWQRRLPVPECLYANRFGTWQQIWSSSRKSQSRRSFATCRLWFSSMAVDSRRAPAAYTTPQSSSPRE